MSEEALSPEQKVQHVKNILMQQISQIYANLANFVKQTPIDEKIKEFSLMNLDQGIMWFEQGVKKLNFVVEKPDAPAPSNESSPEAPAHAEPEAAVSCPEQGCPEQPTQPEGDAA